MNEEKKLKSGFVALIGKPNVGKSTLMNHLIGQKIAITSYKPQTTRNKIQTVYTDDRGQVVFVDTPGIHKAKTKLGEYMSKAFETAIADVDIIIWLVAATDKLGADEQNIARLLEQTKKRVVLAINKTDLLKNKEAVLELIARYKDIYDFIDIVPVSALKDNNVDELMKVIFDLLPEGPLYFDPDVVTNQPVREITAEIIREKALRLLSDEVPHGIAVVIEKMHERKSLMDIEASIICDKDSHKGIIIGKGGAMLKKIGMAARKDIEAMCDMQVNLKLWVKVRKEWRDSDLQMKNFGYDKKSL